MYEENSMVTDNYRITDLFMGFHCGNTCSECMVCPTMKYQLIMHRLMEPEKEPDITRGTLEGRIRPGDITMFRLQSTAGCELKSYIADGEILDVDPKSFGSIAVFAVPEMGRFYRHVLIEHRFPHHAGIAFAKAGKTLYEVLKLLGVDHIYTPLPREVKYPAENPFA
jgi:L-fucose isomerase-like protein